MGKLYDTLKDRKDNGEKLSIDNLDDIMLEELWWNEGIPDSMIADLYDTTKYKITKLRHSYDIKLHNCALFSVLSKI